MARNATPTAPPAAPDSETHYPPPTTGGAFRRLPGGALEPETKTPSAPPAEQTPTNHSGE